MRQWRTDTPPTNKPVEVWYWNAVMLAYYDGKVWRTLDSRLELGGVTQWRPRNA